MRTAALSLILSLSVCLFGAFTLSEQAPSFAFSKSTHDFGKVQAGSVVHTTFEFKNDGDKPLIITDVQVTCGCTTPEYPRKPINPGESAEIKVGFDSNGKSGNFYKAITLMSNSPNSPTRIFIKGTIQQ